MTGLERPLVRSPEFPENLPWLNSRPLRLTSLRGQVVLLDFWDFTCITCVQTFSYLVEWYHRYHDKGLEMIGVHVPEFTFAKDRQLVEAAIVRYGLPYPVVLDNHYHLWQAYGVRAWPTKVVIDPNGYIRNQKVGEGDYDQTEAAIQEMLRQRNPAVELPERLPPLRAEDRPGAYCLPATPEIYCRFDRGQLGNPEGYAVGAVGLYRLPRMRREGVVYISGAWRAEREPLILEGQNGCCTKGWRCSPLVLPLASARIGLYNLFRRGRLLCYSNSESFEGDLIG